MISVKAQQDYLLKHIEGAIYSLNLFCKLEDVKTLHRLRIELKRIKSFTHFVTGGNIKLQKQKLRQLQIIFKHAARIRNLHVYSNLAGDLAGSKFRLKNAAMDRQEWENFVFNCDLYIKYLLTLSHQLAPRLTKISDSAARKWCNRLLKKAKKNLKVRKRDLHEVRKAIKHILYVRELYRDAPVNKAYLKQTEKALGTWHDLHDTILTIRKTKGPAKLQSKLISEEKHEKEKLLELTAKFYKKAKK